MKTRRVHGVLSLDRRTWHELWAVAADASLPLSDRLEALHQMNKLTGLDEPCTKEALDELLFYLD